MKKRKRRYKDPIRRYEYHLAEIPLGSGYWWIIRNGLYKWLMQHRYKCGWRRPYQRTEKRSKKG